jgi:hypothetical protein
MQDYGRDIGNIVESMKNSVFSEMLYFQIFVQILVDFDKLYQNWFKYLQFGFLFSFWSTLKL